MEHSVDDVLNIISLSLISCSEGVLLGVDDYSNSKWIVAVATMAIASVVVMMLWCLLPKMRPE